MHKAAHDASKLTLCAFRAVALDASGGSLPSRLVICPVGNHDARSRGAVIVGPDTFSGLTERQNAMKIGTRLALDFDHNTVPGTPAFAADKEPRNIAAWATLSADPTVGLIFENIEWTPKGIEAFNGKLFQDISPAVFRRADGTVLAVHSAALCRHGEIDGLTIEAASAPSQLAPFFAALSASITPPSTPMLPILRNIAAALGIDLAENADDAAVAKAGDAIIAKIKAGAAAPASADKDADGMSAEVKLQLTTLSAQVKTLTEQNEANARAELMRQAAAEGKVIPLSADVLKITPLAVLTEIVAKATPGEVPLGRTTPKVSGEHDGAVIALTAEDEEVLRKMGISKEDFEAHGPGAKTAKK